MDMNDVWALVCRFLKSSDSETLMEALGFLVPLSHAENLDCMRPKWLLSLSLTDWATALGAVSIVSLPVLEGFRVYGKSPGIDSELVMCSALLANCPSLTRLFFAELSGCEGSSVFLKRMHRLSELAVPHKSSGQRSSIVIPSSLVSLDLTGCELCSGGVCCEGLKALAVTANVKMLTIMSEIENVSVSFPLLWQPSLNALNSLIACKLRVLKVSGSCFGFAARDLAFILTDSERFPLLTDLMVNLTSAVGDPTEGFYKGMQLNQVIRCFTVCRKILNLAAEVDRVKHKLPNVSRFEVGWPSNKSSTFRINDIDVCMHAN